MKVHYAVGKYIIAIFILLLLVITTLLFFTSHIQDFDYENKDQEELSFLSQGNRLSGTLLTPQHKTPSAVIVVIHGDGPQDRYSNGGYNPLFNTFLDANIAIFSWDKAGIGDSQGNWLHQSMEARAEEAVAALKLMQLRYPEVQVGFLGFLKQDGLFLSPLVNHNQLFL